MKIRIFSLLLAVLLTLTGCGLYTSAAEALTEDDAIAIALEDAGLTEDQITGLRVRYEVDDRVPEYEVEFRYNRQEYDYTIHAETGEILSRDRDD